MLLGILWISILFILIHFFVFYFIFDFSMLLGFSAVTGSENQDFINFCKSHHLNISEAANVFNEIERAREHRNE